MPTHYRSSLGICYALSLRQNAVTNYQYCGVEAWDQREISWKNLAPSRFELAHITSLQILLVYMSDVERVAWILKRTRALQHLDLAQDSIHLDNSHLSCCEMYAEIFKDLFSSAGNFRYPAKLKTLRITSMCLEKSGKLLPSLLIFKSLETLQLIECSDIGSLPQNLTPLRLHISSVYIDRGSNGPCDHATISAFIASLAAPKRLSLLCEVDYPSNGQVDMECLQQHAQSIEYLRLEDNNITCLTYGNSDQTPHVYKFFQHASNLKQLALSGPDLEDESEVAEFLVSIRPSI
jgi:hypothetical protein